MWDQEAFLGVGDNVLSLSSVWLNADLERDLWLNVSSGPPSLLLAKMDEALREVLDGALERIDHARKEGVLALAGVRRTSLGMG